jgi:hypothetical protein
MLECLIGLACFALKILNVAYPRATVGPRRLVNEDVIVGLLHGDACTMDTPEDGSVSIHTGRFSGQPR